MIMALDRAIRNEGKFDLNEYSTEKMLDKLWG
jgi:hypothetical protein